jgi:hypothetical protein
MTLAIVLVIAAVIGLVLIARVTISGRLQLAHDALRPIQPIDVEAFRNLADPEQTAYLRGRLSTADFRRVQRQRLRAMDAYLQVAGRNAANLVTVGQRALSAPDTQTAEAARQLVESALLLRRNTAFARLRIQIALAWPDAGPAGVRFLTGYERLSSAAMLLGRLQQPAVPVRISAH